MDLTNLTISVGQFNFSTSSVDFSVFSVIGSLSTCWVAIANVILLTVILSSAHLRAQFRVQLMVCMAVCDITSGVIANAFFTASFIKKSWNFGCAFHLVLQTTGLFADIFLTMWYLVILDASYFATLMNIHTSTLTRLGQIIFRTCLIVFPLVLFCVVVVPMMFTHIEHVNRSSDVFCLLYLESDYEVAMSFIILFIPATVVLSFCACFIKFRNKPVMSRETLARTLLEEHSMVERPLYFLLPSIMMVILALPEQVINALMFSHLLPAVDGLDWLYRLCSSMELMRGGILPLTWLIFPDIRKAFKDIVLCRTCRTTLPVVMTVSNVTYKNLQND